MRCSKCGVDSTTGRRFCANCGSLLAIRCPKCAAENSPLSKFCEDCGTLLASPALSTPQESAHSNAAHVEVRLSIAPSASAGVALEGERKTVTTLFADIKGSMELIEDLDPEEARAIVDPALKLMIDAVHHYGGYVAQSTGDGIFALFGAPVAHEDHPQRALFAALRMQQAMKRYSDSRRAEGRLPTQVRVGVNTGEVVARTINTDETHAEYAPIGHSISLAARLQALAPIGSIAATEQVKKLCEGYFAFTALGPTKVKGVSDPVNVYEVTGLGPIRTRLQRAAGRGYTKFVGRERELRAMKSAAERAKAGHGQIVAAIGEPGVGKSRLFFEFKASSQSGWLVLEAFSFSHGKATPYLPLIELLHDYFKIAPDDEPRTRREKVAGKVTLLDRSLEEALPYLFALLGVSEGADPFAQMDTQARRRHTQEPIKRLLLRESLNQPLMLVFEDLHWVDEETHALLNLLAEGIATAPILMLINYRPEYSHEWGGKGNYTELRLQPLGKESAGEMLATLLSDGKDLGPLKRLIIEKTEGNPLFMEEVVQALFDEGALVRNGAVKVTRALSQLKIPPTVQGILAARIDRLPPDEKELLQTLAVIGTEFPLGLVRQVVPLLPERLDRMLSDLQTGEFIFEQPAAGDIAYIFKHALTHDVAYNSLLSERRRLLHERTAQAIEALYHERIEDHYADLAHHYRLSANAAKAVEYLRLAAEQAVDRGAYRQALPNVESALRLIEQLPEIEQVRAELAVRSLEGRIVPVLYGVGSTERLQTADRMCKLAEQLGDHSALIHGLINAAFAHVNGGEARRAQDIASRCLRLAEQSQNPEMLPHAYMLAGWCAYRSGDLVPARSWFNAGMRGGLRSTSPVTTRITPLTAWAASPWMFALVEQALGRPDEAVRLSDEALRRARELKQPFALSSALGAAATLRYQRREPEAVRDLAEAGFALAEEHGFRDRVIEGRSLRAWATIELSQMPQYVGELEAATTISSGFFLMIKSALLARIYLRIGRGDRALALLDDELARSERSGTRLEEPELHRLRAEAILMLDPSATPATEACLRKAIEIARGQSAKWSELRATVSLARLLANQGKRDEARSVLAEIYNWFTEGFDTLDLKDAKALLEELRN